MLGWVRTNGCSVQCGTISQSIIRPAILCAALPGAQIHFDGQVFALAGGARLAAWLAVD